MSDLRPMVGNWKSKVKRALWLPICYASWEVEEVSMKRIGFIAGVVLAMAATLLMTLPIYAEGPDWSLDTPPGGDFATKDITYTQPQVKSGKAWFFTNGNVVPCGVNGGYPGNHTAYVDTYDSDLWPSDDTFALHVPATNVKVAYWCSGESNPSPQNQHWVLLPTWRDGLDDPTRHGVDFPLYAQNTCKVAVYNGDGYPSAIVSNIHTRHADDAKCAERDRNYGHWSFVLHFTLVDLDAQATPTSTPTLAPTNTPRPTPTPAPTWTPIITGTPTLLEIRDAAWLSVGVEYNPEAAFSTYARAHSLGAPLANEFDLRGYRIQPFMGGVVYARIGDWQNVKSLTW